MAGTRPRESAVDRIRERVEEKAARRAVAQQTAARAPQRDANQPPPGAPSPEELPGIHAEKPTEIPWRGWKQIVKRAWAENKADNMPIIGGGVAFFGFLSIFPALIALISIYGLVASPETVARQVEDISAQLPSDATQLIEEQLRALPLLLAIAFSWSPISSAASSGSWAERSATWRVTVSGEATRP